MATKKQKREAAQAKRAEFEAKIKADGLKALQISQAQQTKERQQDVEDEKSDALYDRQQRILNAAAADRFVEAMIIGRP